MPEPTEYYDPLTQDHYNKSQLPQRDIQPPYNDWGDLFGEIKKDR